MIELAMKTKTAERRIGSQSAVKGVITASYGFGQWGPVYSESADRRETIVVVTRPRGQALGGRLRWQAVTVREGPRSRWDQRPPFWQRETGSTRHGGQIRPGSNCALPAVP